MEGLSISPGKVRMALQLTDRHQSTKSDSFVVTGVGYPCVQRVPLVMLKESAILPAGQTYQLTGVDSVSTVALSRPTSGRTPTPQKSVRSPIVWF